MTAEMEAEHPPDAPAWVSTSGGLCFFRQDLQDLQDVFFCGILIILSILSNMAATGFDTDFTDFH